MRFGRNRDLVATTERASEEVSKMGSTMLHVMAPFKFMVKFFLLVLFFWALGEVVGRGLESMIGKLSRCKLPDEVEQKVRETFQAGLMQETRLVLEEEPQDICEDADVPADHSLPMVLLTGEIDSVYSSLSEIFFAYNNFVSVAKEHNIQYIHRPFFNVRFVNDHVIDSVESLLSFGRRETSLVNLYYANNVSFRIVNLPLHADAVDRFIHSQKASRR